MTTYTQARQAEQENAANVRALTEQRKNAESVYKKTDGETFREYVARHKSAEGQKQLERIKQASDKETRAKIAQHFYRNNSRAAFVAEFLPTLENLLKKYAGKPYGDKTRDKIAQKTSEKHTDEETHTPARETAKKRQKKRQKRHNRAHVARADGGRGARGARGRKFLFSTFFVFIKNA